MRHYGSHSNFSLVGPLISFWHPKYPMYTHVIDYAHQLLADHMPNFGLIGPSIGFWQPIQPLVGVAMTKLHPLPHPCFVNNAS